MHEKTTRWVLGRHKCDKIFATYLNLISCTFIMWFQPSSWKIIHTHLHHIVWRIDYAKAKHHISSCCLFFYCFLLCNDCWCCHFMFRNIKGAPSCQRFLTYLTCMVFNAYLWPLIFFSCILIILKRFCKYFESKSTHIAYMFPN